MGFITRSKADMIMHDFLVEDIPNAGLASVGVRRITAWLRASVQAHSKKYKTPSTALNGPPPGGKGGGIMPRSWLGPGGSWRTGKIKVFL